MKITLPKNWNEVTIGMFQDIEALKVFRAADEFERQLKIISILSGTSIDILKTVDLDDLKKISSSLIWLQELPKAPESFPIEIKLDDHTYNVKYLPKQLNAGEYITLASLTEDKNQIISNLHKIMAVLCSDKSDFNERADYFQKHMSIQIAYPLAFFFLSLFDTFIKTIQAYSEYQMTMTLKKLKRHLRKQILLNGLKRLIPFRKAMLPNGTIS